MFILNLDLIIINFSISIIGLSEVGAPPPSINYVITTHGHPDHSGNTNYFPDALHYAGRFKHRGGDSNFSRIFQVFPQQLSIP